MSRHEATFEIESKSDAHVVRLLTERTFDTLREELSGRTGGEGIQRETLQNFEEVRDEARGLSPGTLTVVYEPDDEAFDG